MNFLRAVGRTLKSLGSSNSQDNVSIDGDKESKKFSLWIFGSGFGCLGFAVAAAFILIIAVLIHLGIIDIDTSSSKKTCVNLPAIDNVCKSITPDGYETMSVDEYVAGVINAEVGGMLDDGLNTYKASAVAARSYALANATKDGNGNCSVPVGPSFQAFKSGASEEMIKAASETSGVVLVKDNQIISSQYDALCIESEDAINYYLCQGGEGEEHLMVPKNWLKSKWSDSYIEETRKLTHGNGMSQNGAWYLALDRGWDYIKILEYFYGDDGVILASINGATTNCTSSFNGDFSPLETYNLSHAGLDVLNRGLTESEMENLNNYIISEVDKAGYGTGAGVAAAGQALTYWLEQQGYYLSYYWGGGQGVGSNTFVGANPNWGTNAYGTDYNGRNPRPYFGMDCSGFTSWAVRNACKPSFGSIMAGYWYELNDVNYISLSEAKPGDMLDGNGHVQLVLKNNGDGSVIVAEEAGGNTSGLVFSLVNSSNAGYKYVVDMSEWYSKNCDSSR